MRILATHTGGWIGDMVLMQPALRALKWAMPAAHLTLHVRPRVRDLMARNPLVDAVLVSDGARGIRGALRWRRELIERAFDIAIVWHPTSVRAALLPWLARIPVRVGHRIAGRGLFLTHSLPNSNEHETTRYLRVLRLLAVPQDALVDRRTEFWSSDDARKFARAFLDARRVASSDTLVGMNLGTTWPTKAWEPQRFAQVARQLTADGARVLVTGSDAERPVLEEFKREAGDAPFIDAVAQCDIFQTAALIERCNVYVTADSGPMHIAAAVGTPVVALFGPTSAARHGPVAKGHITLREPPECAPCYKRRCSIRDQFLCMRSIAVDPVVAAVRRALHQAG